MPAFTRISNSLKLAFLLGSKGIEGAYPDPLVEEVELLGISGAYTLICY